MIGNRVRHQAFLRVLLFGLTSAGAASELSAQTAIVEIGAPGPLASSGGVEYGGFAYRLAVEHPLGGGATARIGHEKFRLRGDSDRAGTGARVRMVAAGVALRWPRDSWSPYVRSSAGVARIAETGSSSASTAFALDGGVGVELGPIKRVGIIVEVGAIVLWTGDRFDTDPTVLWPVTAGMRFYIP